MSAPIPHLGSALRLRRMIELFRRAEHAGEELTEAAVAVTDAAEAFLNHFNDEDR